MIGLIYGPKGSGKTKEIVRRANEALDVSKGNIVYITDSNEYTSAIPAAIRYVNAAEYLPENGSISEDALVGFVKGVIASNSDVTEIFIDGIARMLKKKRGRTRRAFHSDRRYIRSRGGAFLRLADMRQAPQIPQKILLNGIFT